VTSLRRWGSRRRLANVDRCLVAETFRDLVFSDTVRASGSALIKNLTFQYALINSPVVTTINFASCMGLLLLALSHNSAATLVYAFVTRRLDHCCSALVVLPLTLIARLDGVLLSAARLICYS